MKFSIKHQLPALARLSTNGNLLIQHPLTEVFHWFTANGEYLGLLELENVSLGMNYYTDEEDFYPEVPSYVWEMISFGINNPDGSNLFIARFPTPGNNFQPSPNRFMGVRRQERRGSEFITNIFGRRSRKCYNPTPFKTVFVGGERTLVYCINPSRFLQQKNRGNRK